MVTLQTPISSPYAPYIERLEAGEALLPHSPTNLLEVVGILKSYGVVLDAYSNNLIFVGENTFLNPFPFFKYFNGKVSLKQLLRHWWHDRINYEYAEYCVRTMLWHGGGGLDTFVDSPEFAERTRAAMQRHLRSNPLSKALDALFPKFFLEQAKMLAYYSALGQFWRIMSDMFIDLSDQFDRGKIKDIPDVVTLIQDALVANASVPITYRVHVDGQTHELIPKSAGLTFLMDTAVPYVESVFFRGTPFMGVISYNAQAHQIPNQQEDFGYGALYADPLPSGGAGIPPTLLMQDMRHFLPDYLHEIYLKSHRGEDDLLVKICQSFQKSMFCVTTAAIRGLAPFPLETGNPDEQSQNRAYLTGWLTRLVDSRLTTVNPV